MRKKLIVAGDSCSDLTFRSAPHPEMDTSWPKWPEILAEYLDMDLVSFAHGGQGNEYVYSGILEEVTTRNPDEIGYVIAAWSQCHREDWTQTWIEPILCWQWKSTRVSRDGNLLSWVNRSMRFRMSLTILCEHYNVPYAQFQTGDIFENYICGLQPTEKQIFEGEAKLGERFPYPRQKRQEFDREKIHECIQRSKDRTREFLGWPGQKELFYRGYYKVPVTDRPNFSLIPYQYGWNLLDKVINIYDPVHPYDDSSMHKYHRDDLVISDLDDHPNELGHKQIAKFLIQELNL